MRKSHHLGNPWPSHFATGSLVPAPEVDTATWYLSADKCTIFFFWPAANGGARSTPTQYIVEASYLPFLPQLSIHTINPKAPPETRTRTRGEAKFTRRFPADKRVGNEK
jgi:hypothetical protein